jgi:hypothetical protein
MWTQVRTLLVDANAFIRDRIGVICTYLNGKWKTAELPTMKKTPLLLLALSALCTFSGKSQPPQGNAQAGRGGSGYFQTLVREAKSRIKEIEVGQFQKGRSATPATAVVEVRENNEWDKGRIPGAIHVGRGVLDESHCVLPERQSGRGIRRRTREDGLHQRLVAGGRHRGVPSRWASRGPATSEIAPPRPSL